MKIYPVSQRPAFVARIEMVPAQEVVFIGVFVKQLNR